MITAAYLPWIIAFWVIGLVVVAAIANMRGLEVGQAIGLSIFLSPIAGVIYTLLAKPTPKPQSGPQMPAPPAPTSVVTSSAISSASHFCPNCGTPRTGQRFCAACGNDFWKAAAPGVADAPTAAKTTSPAGSGLRTVLLVAIAIAVGVGILILVNRPPAPPNLGGASTDIPPAGEVWFGTTFDPNTLSLSGHRQMVGVQEGFAVVAHLTRSIDASQMVVRIYLNGSLVASNAANATGTSDTWGFSGGPLYSAGTWRWEFTDIGGNVLASGEVTAS